MTYDEYNAFCGALPATDLKVPVLFGDRSVPDVVKIPSVVLLELLEGVGAGVTALKRERRHLGAQLRRLGSGDGGH